MVFIMASLHQLATLLMCRMSRPPNVGLSEIRKPQVRILSSRGNSFNLKGKRVYQRWVQRMPSTKIIVYT